MHFHPAQFPTVGWSAGVQFQVAWLFPEREQAGALGAIPGYAGDQSNSRHSLHSPFEGKANKEGVYTPPHRLRRGNTVCISAYHKITAVPCSAGVSSL